MTIALTIQDGFYMAEIQDDLRMAIVRRARPKDSVWLRRIARERRILPTERQALPAGPWCTGTPLARETIRACS